MSNKRPFFPNFMEKIDTSLLLNNPITWSTRIHQFAWYGVMFTLFLALLCFVVPDDPRATSFMVYWITILVIVSLLAFIGWLIFLLRFNVFKRYGQWNKTDTLKTFLVYFFITAVIVSWSFIPLIVQSVRADWKYSTREMIKDMNDINLKTLQLERKRVDTTFRADTFRIDNSVTGPVSNETTYYDTYYSKEGEYYRIDTGSLRLKLKVADRYVKLTDSVYIVYTSPRYIFVENWTISGEDSTIKTLSSYDLYKLVFNSNQQYNDEVIRNELTELTGKYRIPEVEKRRYRYDWELDSSQGYYSVIQQKYKLESVNDSLSNIADKKYRWSDGFIGFTIRFIIYSALILSLLVLMFRHMTRRTFFLSILAGVVIFILTTIFTIGAFDTEYGSLIWLLIYFATFAVIAATIFSNKTRAVIPGIALNLAVSMVTFVPLILTELYYSILRQKYLYREDSIQYRHLFKNEEMHFLVAEISGFAILLLLLGTVVGAAYKRWYSLPEL